MTFVEGYIQENAHSAPQVALYSMPNTSTCPSCSASNQMAISTDPMGIMRLSHNASFTIYIKARVGGIRMVPLGALTPYDVTQTVTVNANNLLLTQYPDWIIPWDPATMTQVNLASTWTDAQTGLASVTYSLYSSSNSSSPIKTQTFSNIARAGNHSWNWDGKDSLNITLPKGLYTTKVSVTANVPTMTSDNNRSEYLQLLVPTDANGQPIYDASCEGIDDNGTTDPSDDNYLYYVKAYNLKDTLGTNASEGEIWLYDPGLVKVGAWSIASLQCRAHGNASDGLNASTTGITHELFIPVPVSSMNEDGTYRFVAHVKDDHADRYRNHEKRWAIEVNQIAARKKLTLEYDWMVGAGQLCTTDSHKIVWEGLPSQWARANYSLVIEDEHDSNCDHFEYIGETLTDDDIAFYVNSHENHVPECDLYLIGCHRYKRGQFDASGLTVPGTGGHDLCMVFMWATGGLNIFQKTCAELHETACHDDSVGAIGHCSTVNQCPCYELNSNSTIFCANCLAKLKAFNQ